MDCVLRLTASAFIRSTRRAATINSAVKRALDWGDLRMRRAKGTRISGLVVALAIAMNLPSMAVAAGSRLILLAQAMIPRTGMMDAQNRYLKRIFRNEL
jgi:hypothetical protein